MSIESFDLRELSDDQLAEMHLFEEVIEAEARPEDPPRPLENYISSIRTMPAYIDERVLIARDSNGALAGEAECAVFLTDERQHLAQLSISVRPDMRSRGIGRELLEGAVEFASSRGRTTLIGVSTNRVKAGEAFARAVGAKDVQTSTVNRLLLANVDRSRVEGWIEQGPLRAPGYSLFNVDAPLPEDLIERVTFLLDVMNDAPRGEVAISDVHTTVAQLRDREQQAAAVGAVQWWIFAKNDATGELVGLTELSWNPSSSQTVWQGATGVVGEHRGHALGKWMKASMLKRVLEQCEGAVDLRTSNADANAAMVGINQALGFEPYIAQTTWQVEISTVTEYLDCRRTRGSGDA